MRGWGQGRSSGQPRGGTGAGGGSVWPRDEGASPQRGKSFWGAVIRDGWQLLLPSAQSCAMVQKCIETLQKKKLLTSSFYYLGLCYIILDTFFLPFSSDKPEVIIKHYCKSQNLVSQWHFYTVSILCVIIGGLYAISFSFSTQQWVVLVAVQSPGQQVNKG